MILSSQIDDSSVVEMYSINHCCDYLAFIQCSDWSLYRDEHMSGVIADRLAPMKRSCYS